MREFLNKFNVTEEDLSRLTEFGYGLTFFCLFLIIVAALAAIFEASDKE